MGERPDRIDPDVIAPRIDQLLEAATLRLGNRHDVPFRSFEGGRCGQPSLTLTIPGKASPNGTGGWGWRRTWQRAVAEDSGTFLLRTLRLLPTFEVIKFAEDGWVTCRHDRGDKTDWLQGM